MHSKEAAHFNYTYSYNFHNHTHNFIAVQMCFILYCIMVPYIPVMTCNTSLLKSIYGMYMNFVLFYSLDLVIL